MCLNKRNSFPHKSGAGCTRSSFQQSWFLVSLISWQMRCLSSVQDHFWYLFFLWEHLSCWIRAPPTWHHLTFIYCLPAVPVSTGSRWDVFGGKHNSVHYWYTLQDWYIFFIVFWIKEQRNRNIRKIKEV